MNWNTMAMIAMTVLYAANLQAKPMNLDCEFHLQAGVVYIHCCLLLLLLLGQLQCFDAVGWAAGRASGL